MNKNREKWVLFRSLEEGQLNLDQVSRVTAIEQGPTMVLDSEASPLGPQLAAGLEAGLLDRQQIHEWMASLTDEGWERYEVKSILGMGGFAVVYHVFDHKLNRDVALKFLKDERAERTEAILEEARFQARVDHPHICKVYEVGMLNDRPFIAMQFIEGETLAQLAPRLSLAELIQITIQVAQALSSAHQLGLIHRDIKPGNILVQKRDGQWHAFVTDFGLAREVTQEKEAAPENISGTPGFMSPEQVLAQPLDHRSDIYGLGATFYSALTGQSPHHSRSRLKLLDKIVHEPPPPLRKHHARAPSDLEAVIMKCLQKMPEQRYSSAQELALDLERFLDHKPVHAFGGSPIYRSRKFLHRHRLLLLVTALAVVCLAVLGANTWKHRWRASRLNQLEEEFSQELDFILETLRYAYTAPLHGTGAERQKAQQRLLTMASRTGEQPPWAQGPGYSALGRAYLALGQVNKAHQALQLAWNAGFRNGHTCMALGRVYRILYQDGLFRLEVAGDIHERQAIQDQLETQYRRPALRYLSLAQNVTTEAPDFQAALIAFVEGDLDRAETHCQAVNEITPWIYEADILLGDICATRAAAARERGEEDAATLVSSRAEAYYNRARRKAPSDARVYLGLAEIHLHRILARGISGKAPQESDLLSGLEASDQALQAEGLESSAHYQRAALLTYFAWYHYLFARTDPMARLELAEESARQASKLMPASPRVEDLWGLIYFTRLRFDNDRGRDSRSHAEQAITHFQAAIDLGQADSSTRGHLGLAWIHRGQFEQERGLPPAGESIDRGVRQLRLARNSAPNSANINTNLAFALFARAIFSMEHGQDPLPSFHEGASLARAAHVMNPKHVLAPIIQLFCESCAAIHEASQGQDPKASSDRAMAVAHSLAQELPMLDISWTFLGLTHIALGFHEASNHRSPESEYDLAHRALQQALQRNPFSFETHLFRAQLAQWKGLWAHQRQSDPEPLFAQAESEFNLAQHIKPSSARLFRERGKLYRFWAQYRQQKYSELPTPSLADKALTDLERALALRPGFADALIDRACLLAWLAQSQPNSPQHASWMEQARRDADKALKLNANLTWEYAPQLPWMAEENEVGP